MLRRVLGISLLGAGCANAATPDLLTTAERTEFRTKGRHAEVGQLCAAYQRAWPR
jgi:hypothetical protein